MCGVGQPLEIGQFGDIIAHQHNIRRIHRNITAQSTHRNAHIGRFQRRRIIHTVPDHTDRFAAFLNGYDVFDLFFRQKLCPHLPNAHLTGKIIRGLLIVTGQQNDIRIHTVQTVHHTLGRPAQHIGHCHHTDAFCTLCHQNRGLSLGTELFKGAIDPIAEHHAPV